MARPATNDWIAVTCGLLRNDTDCVKSITGCDVDVELDSVGLHGLRSLEKRIPSAEGFGWIAEGGSGDLPDGPDPPAAVLTSFQVNGIKPDLGLSYVLELECGGRGKVLRPPGFKLNLIARAIGVGAHQCPAL